MAIKIALERIEAAKKNNYADLDLSDLQLLEIPMELSKLSQLSFLDLSNNKISEIKNLENLTRLAFLKLNNNQITEIKGLENLTRLTSLKLNYNQVTEIKGLEKNSQLADLGLGSNQVTEIKGLEKLKALNVLGLELNQITEIKGLEALKNLSRLYLYGNDIKEITGLEALTQLTILNLAQNKLIEIKGLDTLKSLTNLYLDLNQITEIKGFSNLVQINLIELENNLITEIPEHLLDLGLTIYWARTGSQGILIENNPLINPPPEIIKQGNKAIKEYFKQRNKSGEELLLEAKLILLGDARSGKTSLANRLLKKELPKETDRTKGVDIVIGEYDFPLLNGKNFKINIWDFAGHDKYKTLHQLFYTESSVYVMLAEAGNTTVDFDDWFQTAALFVEGSPLILVLNEFKERIGMSSNFDSAYWKKQFPELLKEVLPVNLSSKENFSVVEEYIQMLAKNLPHTKYAFPSNWAAIRRVLNERRNEQYITLPEYLEICEENNLPEKESALILSSVLHKVGDCLHYQKNELLKQFIILKNEWATEAVYKILDDAIVAEQKSGFFDLSDTRRIWSNAEYEDMRPQLLELMKQFKLAYQLPGKEEFVTPPLLPPGRPEKFVWPANDSLELFIEYEFLPKALMTQFIVTRNADIAEGRTLVWRHGVILKWDGEALAEVSRAKLEGRDAFYIRVQGNNRRGMMTVILKTFRELHAEYKGIKYKEKVSCICDGCKNKKNKQHYFDFNSLQFRLGKGRLEVECENSLETLKVMDLLENSFVFENTKEAHGLQLKGNVTGENVNTIRILNLFLASSKELEFEREKIEIAIGRKNDTLRKKGILIDLLMWEDDKQIGRSIRSQDNYNDEIKRCNVFAMMFYSKVGRYSLEEFELACTTFETKGTPRILVYQKAKDLPGNQSQEEANSRFEFLEKLKKLENFPVKFDNEDKLIRELEAAIDNLLADEDFVKELRYE